MSAIRFFTDEDVYGSVAGALRRLGIDAVSTPEVGRLHESDDSQLRWAAAEGRVFITFNVGHFAARHWQWLHLGQHHGGVIVSRQLSIGELLRRLKRVANALEAADMIDRLEFLSDW